MVQRSGYGGPRIHRGDPTEPVREERQGGGATMQSFMDTVLSPFVQCVSPPLQACVSPSTPWQPRHVPRSTSPPNPVTPVSNTKPLYVTQQFGENDILCGKGRSSICHPGNQRFREIVEANKGEYARATRKQKVFLAHSIVDLIQNANPPGRFLLRDVETGRWYDIGRSRSFEKTSQSLREKPNPSVNTGLPNPPPQRFGRPSLIIPQHLKHVYQPPHSHAEYRNPPHSAESPPPHGMYMYPIPSIASVSSYELISPCNSNVSESNSSPPMPRRGLSPRPCTPSDAGSSLPLPSSRAPISPPSERPLSVSPPPSAVFSETSSTAQSFASSFMFDTPVDGGYRENNLVAPSTVRRNRHASGEDGLAALSAAAFLKLDEIE